MGSPVVTGIVVLYVAVVFPILASHGEARSRVEDSTGVVGSGNL
jgi:hypothetical protein